MPDRFWLMSEDLAPGDLIRRRAERIPVKRKMPAPAKRVEGNPALSAYQPRKGPIKTKASRIIRLLMESTVALISEGVISLIWFLRMGVAIPLMM